MESDGSALVQVASIGLGPGRHRGVLRRDRSDSVCPLKVSGIATGALAIFRLLQQKAGLDPVDRELLDLLAARAATAMSCAGLHVPQGPGVRMAACRTRPGLSPPRPSGDGRPSLAQDEAARVAFGMPKEAIGGGADA